MPTIFEIQQEHKRILNQLDNLESISNNEKEVLKETKFQMQAILNLWNAHEEKEEELFKSISPNFPVKTMQTTHQLLRGHWKVLSLALQSQDDEIIKIALETDGKMFSDRLRNHITEEERFFAKL